VAHDINRLAENFRENGFVIVPKFLSTSQLDELDRELDRYLRDVLPEVPRTHKIYESGWSGPLKHISRMELYDDYFREFLDSQPNRPILEACLETALEPITSELFFKPPKVGGPALYHQDNAYFTFKPPHGLVVWIALDDVTIENGAVHYSRGSHRLGDIQHEETGVILFGKALAQPPDPKTYPETPAVMKRGDASIHHFLTAHRSGPNRTEHGRRGFVLDFRSVDAEADEAATAAQEAYKDSVYQEFGAFNKQ
jgi:ectoine hydroxylase-related dioxygenase (phytanoyl-CoA dioxygenase family)